MHFGSKKEEKDMRFGEELPTLKRKIQPLEVAFIAIHEILRTQM